MTQPEWRIPCFFVPEEQAVIGNGTAGLTGLHGAGTFQICDGQIVTHSLAVHFDEEGRSAAPS